MSWCARDKAGGPPPYEIGTTEFTIKLHYGGRIVGTKYVGGSFGFIDYCHEDDISLIQFCNMMQKLGQMVSNDYYFNDHGTMSLIKSNDEAITISKLVDGETRLVDLYAITNLDDVVPTQCSQPKINRNKGKEKAVEVPHVQITDSDSEEYDPHSANSEDEQLTESEDEEFHESDDGVEEDDAIFDMTMDDERDCGGDMNQDTEGLDRTVDGMADVDEDSDNSEELDSPGESGTDDERLRKGKRKRYPRFNEDVDIANPVLAVGMEFKTHAIFRDAVKEHAIKLGKKIIFKKSDTKKVQAVCVGKKDCPWFIYGAFVKADGLFRVKHYISQHTCSRSYNIPWVSTKWIVRTYKDRIAKNPTWPIKSIAETIESEWTVNVHKHKVIRARRKALEELEGNVTEQFRDLFGYIEEVKSTNPGTTIKLLTKPIPGSENEVRFKRLYICWGSLKKGFVEGCRPVIGLDGCHLKGKFGGMLLTAVGMDANNCIYPFAYAIVGKEKKKTWLWFLESLKEDLDVQNSGIYTFMTDKQKGLIDAVAELFPNAGHRFCVRHLYNNFKVEFKGLVLKDALWKAARASTVPAFNRAMQELKSLDSKAYEWLNARPAIHWSKSHFDTFPKCDILLNNLSESFNSAILPARDKPIITMLEKIRTTIMEAGQRRKEAMLRFQYPICPKIRKRLNKLREERGWIPRYFGNQQFQVEGPNEQYRVDLTNMTCGCRKWELSGIPCVHACAALNKSDLDPMDYVHDCYKVQTYLNTYDNVLGPINGRDMWPSTGELILLPPNVKRRAGRPKKVRRREPDEVEPTCTKLSRKGMQVTCSLCRQAGHNRRGCTRKGQGGGQPREETAAPTEETVAPTEGTISTERHSVGPAWAGGDSQQSAMTSEIGTTLVGVNAGGTAAKQPRTKHGSVIQESGSKTMQAMNWRGHRVYLATSKNAGSSK